MLRFATVAATGVLALALGLGCGDKQNPLGDYQAPGGSGGAAGMDAGGGGGSLGVSYAQTIAPLLARSCATTGCHDKATGMAGVTLDTYEAVKANAEESNVSIQNGTMPVGSAPRLTDAEREAFAEWVAAGAPNN